MKTLRHLFFDQLEDIYQAEQRIARTLARLAKAATYERLQQALRNHGHDTLGHVSKVARIFECFGEKAEGGKGHALAGLLNEGAALVSAHDGSPAIDAAIISVVQKFEHYEIASYGCLRDWARVLGNHEAAILLESILDEEKAGDLELTEIARECNVDALGESESMVHAENGDMEEAVSRHDALHHQGA